MKKKILAVALIVICVSIIASGTLAYFTTEDKAQNVFTSGGVDITVEEWQIVDGEPQPYPEETPIKIMPGDVVSKQPTVVSADDDTYVRASVVITVLDAEGNDMELTADEIAAIISLDYDTENWLVKDPADGYYYYKDAIGGGTATEALFTEVTFATTMDNEYQHCTVKIDVNAQGVQAANNGTNVLDAQGWE